MSALIPRSTTDILAEHEQRMVILRQKEELCYKNHISSLDAVHAENTKASFQDFEAAVAEHERMLKA
jgi:hypothetical protein